MAIYHLTTKPFSRGKGQSARAKHDYIAREGKFRNGAKEVVYKASGNMPAWAEEEPRMFWKAADLYERGNARLGREIEFALPRELSLEGRVNLAHAFASEVTQDRHPYTLVIHEGRKNHNPHAHLIFSERALDETERDKAHFFKQADPKVASRGGAKKDRAFIQKAWLKATRERWANLANEALEREGWDSRIDHRSLEAQGVTDRLPSRHAGPNIFELERRGVRTDRGSDLLSIGDQEATLRQTLVNVTKELDNEQRRIASRERRRGRSLER